MGSAPAPRCGSRRGTARLHRNRGDEPVEVWAISRKQDGGDATKVDDFWKASPEAAQTR